MLSPSVSGSPGCAVPLSIAPLVAAFEVPAPSSELPASSAPLPVLSEELTPVSVSLPGSVPVVPVVPAGSPPHGLGPVGAGGVASGSPVVPAGSAPHGLGPVGAGGVASGSSPRA